ncbi:hypothetical protein DBR06_SOUSAS2110223, partial [Sousa chinensis]
LLIPIVTAPAYKHPLSDTMNAIAKVTNSSDGWICPHSCTSPKDLHLLGLPTSLRDLMGQTAKYFGAKGKKSHSFRKLQLQMMIRQGFQTVPLEDEDYQHPLDKHAASFYSPL